MLHCGLVLMFGSELDLLRLRLQLLLLLLGCSVRLTLLSYGAGLSRQFSP